MTTRAEDRSVTTGRVSREYVVLNEGEGLRLQSGPGRDLVFKVTGEQTHGACDYFVVEVAPHGGPPSSLVIESAAASASLHSQHLAPRHFR